MDDKLKARKCLLPDFDSSTPSSITDYGFYPFTMPSERPYFTRSCKNKTLYGSYNNKRSFDQTSLSDYGTGSEASFNSSRKSTVTSGSTATSPRASVGPCVRSPMDLSDIESDLPLAYAPWDSDTEENVEKDWESDADSTYYKALRKQYSAYMLRCQDVIIMIPKESETLYDVSQYVCRILKDDFYSPLQNTHIKHVGPVVMLEPHGTKFYQDKPAIIWLPVYEQPTDESQLIVLCSNTVEGMQPQWEPIPSELFLYNAGYIAITARHFSLFTAVLEEPYPEVMKRVRCRAGATVRVHSVPGVEVTFPRGCLEQNIDAVIKVFFTSEPGVYTSPYESLASPVIMVGPHGYQFGSTRQPVIIQVPVPHYNEILQRFGPHAKLTVWQSSNSENEHLQWEPLDIELTIRELRSGLVVVSFPVRHFSFFKVIWDILTNSLYEAKMGMSYFYPHISFSMMCQAFMEENTNKNRFALEVICYRSDKRCTDLWEATNLKHKVGSSLKPKLMKPGRIIIRLKSQMFEGDVEAGEDVEMVKIEPDFRGRDFEKQYACRYKDDCNVDRGIIGKVVVERELNPGRKEQLFEFNIHKRGCEDETNPDISDRWSLVAIKELAATLNILNEQKNWKRLARYVGFTNHEIKSKLQYSADPFVSMVNLYAAREGTPEEFVDALYAVSREITLASQDPSTGGASGSSSGLGSGSSKKSSENNRSPLAWKWQGLERWRGAGQDTDSGTASQASGSIKRKHSSSKRSKESSNNSKRRKTNKSPKERTPTPSSTSSANGSEEEEESSDEKEKEKAGSSVRYRKDISRLSDTNLWDISEFLNVPNWKALGRTLGLEESILSNVENASKSNGFRECAYQMFLEWKGRMPKDCTFGRLYTALMKEKMNRAAKELTQKTFHKKSIDDN